jgi:uncharacterized protein (DUF1810 family)
MDFDLNRFVEAQDGEYEQALAELRRAQKESHWMWFIFPQLDGLGRSPTARFFAIKSPAEARAYLEHAVLGPRLLKCCEVLLCCKGRSATEIFGFPDDLKLRSSMTLFAAVPGSNPVYSRVLAQFFEGAPDPRTLELLRQPAYARDI